MRAAVECAVNNDDIRSRYDLYECTPLGKVYHKLKDALATPPRNCDVGTAEEQSKRFIDFCDAHQKELSIEDDGTIHTMCESCPIQKLHEGVQHDETIICGIDWAQLPYEGEVGK